MKKYASSIMIFIRRLWTLLSGIMFVIYSGASLIALSMRNCFWSQEALPNLGNFFTKTTYYFLIAVIALVGSVNYVWDAITDWNAYRVMNNLWIPVVFLFAFFDPKYVAYNFRYFKSAWWRDTRIFPSDICGLFSFHKKDAGYSARQGLYGEYLASMTAEELLRKHGEVKGFILNGALIPTDEDDGFTEADIISVSEYGIHVIEVKNWRSKVEGNMDDKHLGQHDNPFSQNLYHCNMLYDYLYKVLPECPLKRRNLNEIMKNVILFTSPFFTNKMYGKRYYRSYGGYTRDYLHLRGYISNGFFGEKKVLSPEEVALLERILRPQVCSEEEKKVYMAKRKAAAKSKKRHSPSYRLKEILCPDICGNYRNTLVVERTLDGHKAYLDILDRRFRAIPNHKEVEDTAVQELSVDYIREEDEWEKCPDEIADAYYAAYSGNPAYAEKGVAAQINDVNRDTKYKEFDSKANLKRFGFLAQNKLLYALEKGLDSMYHFLMGIGLWGMILLFVGGLLSSSLSGDRMSSWIWVAIWLASPLGLVQLVGVPLNVLKAYNRYAYRILESDSGNY